MMQRAQSSPGSEIASGWAPVFAGAEVRLIFEDVSAFGTSKAAIASSTECLQCASAETAAGVNLLRRSASVFSASLATAASSSLLSNRSSPLLALCLLADAQA